MKEQASSVKTKCAKCGIELVIEVDHPSFSVDKCSKCQEVKRGRPSKNS